MSREFFRLGRWPFAVAWMMLPLCWSLADQACGEDWPRWLGPRGDSVWRDANVLRTWPAEDPPIVWRTSLNAGYSGPAVADGRVFITDRVAVKDDQGKPVKDGDRGLKGTERVLCLDAESGEQLWVHEYDCPYRISYDAGPRTTPLVNQERVYCLGAMGDLLCLNVADGSLLWKKNLAAAYQTKPPVWGWAAHPVLDGDQLMLLVGGEGSAVVALDKLSGEERWKALTAEEVGYAPPVFHEKDGRRQMVVWLDTAVHGLDPRTGKPLWSSPFPVEGRPQRPIVTIMTPLIHQDQVLVSNYYNGALNLQLKADFSGAQVLWKSLEKNDQQYKKGLNVLMATPIVIGDHVYGVAGEGHLRCLNWKTGEQLWEEIAVTGERKADFATCFIVRNGEQCWIFNDQGFLILTRLSPDGYEELGRMKVLEPVGFARGRNIVWSHPAFANGRMFARNDQEIVCVDLRSEAIPSVEK